MAKKLEVKKIVTQCKIYFANEVEFFLNGLKLTSLNF